MIYRTVFFGTPDFAAQALLQMTAEYSHRIKFTGVVTQPPQRIGRRQTLTPSPVHQSALSLRIPVYTQIADVPRTVFTSCDVGLVYAYGEMLHKDLLEAPKLGFYNIHPSLLPRYRGASPITYALMMGEEVSGVSLMRIDQHLDHGPLVAQKRDQVSPADTKKNLEERYTFFGCQLFNAFLAKNPQNAQFSKQDHSAATYSRTLKRDDGYISRDFLRKALHKAPIITADLPSILQEYLSQDPAPLPRLLSSAGETLWNLYRGLFPWPGIWTECSIKNTVRRIKITGLSHSPLTGDTKITSVQIAGKREVDYQIFTRAYGMILEE